MQGACHVAMEDEVERGSDKLRHMQGGTRPPGAGRGEEGFLSRAVGGSTALQTP